MKPWILAIALFAAPLPAAADCIPAEIVSIHDGDTLRAIINGREERVRLMGYDTPEIGDKAQCELEQTLAVLARNRLMALALEADEVEICPNGRDRYRRVLARLMLDGRDVGEILIEEGLARPYEGGRRDRWCKSISDRSFESKHRQL